MESLYERNTALHFNIIILNVTSNRVVLKIIIIWALLPSSGNTRNLYISFLNSYLLQVPFPPFLPELAKKQKVSLFWLESFIFSKCNWAGQGVSMLHNIRERMFWISTHGNHKTSIKIMPYAFELCKYAMPAITTRPTTQGQQIPKCSQLQKRKNENHKFTQK